MSIIFSPKLPYDARFARLEAGETGAKASGLCRRCGRYRVYRPGKLSCCWSPDSPGKLVGDFVWGAMRLVVKRRVANSLVDAFPGLSVKPVVMEPIGRWRRLPGQEELVELVVSETLSITQLPGSTIREDPACPVCGRGFKALEGTEDIAFRHIKGARVRVKVARKPGAGLLVRKKAIAGLGFFCWEGRCNFCTEEVKAMAEAEGWTNVAFREHGETVPR